MYAICQGLRCGINKRGVFTKYRFTIYLLNLGQLKDETHPKIACKYEIFWECKKDILHVLRI